MATDWFTKTPGNPIAPSVEDDGMVIINTGAPDWVRLPPDLGGHRVRVEESFQAPCPMCLADGDVPHLQTEGGICVAECQACGFVWYR